MCKCNEEINVKIKLLHEDSKMPKKAHETDACYDVYVHSLLKFNEEELEYGLGFATEIPAGYKAIVVPRSSFTKQKFVMQNSPAQIDSSFRGEWKLKFKNLYPNYKSVEFPVPWEEGDRIAQVYFEKILPINFEVVEELSDTERGDGGFGSSGK